MPKHPWDRRSRRGVKQHAKSGKGGKHASLFDVGEFVAVDGEGFNRGEEIVSIVGDDQRSYRFRRHDYSLLSASDGTELYSADNKLHTKDCLDFLLRIREANKHSISVCFGASYDMTHMLAFGLTRDEIDYLLHGDGKDAKSLDVTLTSPETGETHDYRLLYRPRKSLSIWRWEAGEDKYEKHRKKDGTTIWRMTKHVKTVLWDVWGFFQSSFVEAMDKWLPGDTDYEFIKKNKGSRSIFERSEIDVIRKYNAAELRCLVSMMERVRDAIRDIGLRITRWDGAGSVSGAMLSHNEIKAHMAESPDEVFKAACAAYSGGHIEACKLGHYDATVHHYDINSAYPDQFRNLPSLAHGSWSHGTDNVIPGFTLVRVQYRYYPGLPFYPLFYRESDGSIKYPERGHGWYWFPEFDAARQFAEKFGAIDFRVLEWWHFKPTLNASPFMWIEEYYAKRQAIVEESKRTGVPNGAEKMYKLGYNGCYGKPRP